MSETKHRRFLREKEATQLLEEFSQKLKMDIKQVFETRNTSVEIAETSTAKIYFINTRPLIAKLKDHTIPTLIFDKALMTLPKITVNMGAVPHIANGADPMAPGIVKIEGNFGKNDYTLIIDERHQKPLAVAVALEDSQTARNLKHGKIAKNIHYVGDNLWNQIKQ